MATECNKTFLGQQPRQVVQWRISRHFEDHLCPRHQDSNDARNVGYPPLSDLARLLNQEYFIKIHNDAMGVACGTHRGEQTCTHVLLVWKHEQETTWRNCA
jgi:hypothetical protein